MSDEPTETSEDKARTVHVQQGFGDLPIDDYEIEAGWEVYVVSGADRELFINKSQTGPEDAELVAMYGQGTWIRTWVDVTE